MTDEIPATPAPVVASTPSVVIDRDAKVAISKRPLFLAIAGVVAFAAFTVVWFAAQEDYEPGPAAKAFLASFAEKDVDVDPDDDELRCIDDIAGDLDPTFFTDGGLDVLGGAEVDDAQKAYAVKVLDDCLRKPSRVALLATGMSEDGSLDREQQTCLAGKVDDAVMESGGYAMLIDMDESSDAAGELVSVIFSSMGACNVDFGQMTGSSDDEG